VTALLVALHGGAFAAQWLLELLAQDGRTGHGWLQHWLALDSAGITAGQHWKWLSFPLLHHGPVHLTANLLLLFFAGREVERIIGGRSFLGLYLLGNLVGGFAHWFVMPASTLVGASAGVAAVVAAYATVLPEWELVMNLFFVVPVRIRAKFVGLAVLAAGVVGWIVQPAPAISFGPPGIIAGCLLGWLIVRQLGFGNPFMVQRYIYRRREREARLRRMNADQFMREEIDPILEKIAREGLPRLTRSERKILELGREKIATKPASR
jgi:membrane associated rhomboid family serine protease